MELTSANLFVHKLTRVRWNPERYRFFIGFFPDYDRLTLQFSCFCQQVEVRFVSGQGIAALSIGQVFLKNKFIILIDI